MIGDRDYTLLSAIELEQGVCEVIEENKMNMLGCPCIGLRPPRPLFPVRYLILLIDPLV